MSEDSDDDEPLSLNMDTLAALQCVMGGDADGGLAQLLQSRRLMQDDSSSEEEEEEAVNDEDSVGMRVGESHADYYKRLYPERYTNNSKNNENDKMKIENPVSYNMQKLILINIFLY